MLDWVSGKTGRRVWTTIIDKNGHKRRLRCQGTAWGAKDAHDAKERHRAQKTLTMPRNGMGRRRRLRCLGTAWGAKDAYGRKGSDWMLLGQNVVRRPTRRRYARETRRHDVDGYENENTTPLRYLAILMLRHGDSRGRCGSLEYADASGECCGL